MSLRLLDYTNSPLILLTVALWAPAVQVCAVEPSTQVTSSEHQFHGYVTYTTNYLYRGITTSFGNPTTVIGGNYQHSSGIFIGGLITELDFNTSEGPNTFNIWFAGWEQAITPDLYADITYTQYRAGGWNPPSIQDEAWVEYSLGLHYKEILSAQVFYTEENYGFEHAATTYEFSARYPIWYRLDVGLTLGYFDLKTIFDPIETQLANNPFFDVEFDEGFQYRLANITYTLPNLAFELSYHSTDQAAHDMEALNLGFVKSGWEFAVTAGF